MPNLVNRSFFVADINIPNADEASVAEKLDMFITRFENECLVKILGYELSKLVKTENSQRMNDLVFGAEYTDCKGKLQLWEGLVVEVMQNTSSDGDNSYWESLIAFYIYYFFEESSASLTTGMTTSVSKAEAGEIHSPADKMCAAWNNFSNRCDSLFEYLNTKNKEQTPVYPEFTRRDFHKGFKLSRTINIFGI